MTKYEGIPGVEIASETLLGDLMQLVIDELKAAPDVWQRLSEHKQDAVIGRVHQRVGDAVRQAIELIAANGRTAIAATLEQVTVKDSYKAVLSMSKADPSLHELSDAVGCAVMIVVADPSELAGGAGDVKADPDQPPLNGFGDSTEVTIDPIDGEFRQLPYGDEE